jgi:nucleoside-diphosphate-sugar epimerase
MKILLIGGLGYVGSYLYEYLSLKNIKIDVCDYNTRGNPANIPLKFFYNYSELKEKDLKKYNSILWFAGHSSVDISVKDPLGALENNFSNLILLLRKIKNKNVKFIYASSASVYSSKKNIYSKETDKIFPKTNYYDISKCLFDNSVSKFYENFFGLRMGTVSGFSKNFRQELIFNKMCSDSIYKKKIFISNHKSYRSILFLSDLAKVIYLLLIKKTTPGIYNLASHSSSIGNLSRVVSKFFNSKIKQFPNSSTYSFKMNISKIKKIGFKNEENLYRELNKICIDLKNNEKRIF